MSCWYAVHTHPNGERKAFLNLNNQGFEVYLPYYMKTRRHARRVDQVKAPLFPRYLFIRMDIAERGWRLINGTFGVAYIVCPGGRPSPVPDRLIRDIRSREDMSGAVRLDKINPLNRGDNVRFVSGPMTDHTGIFDCELDDDRVEILLDLMGRQMRVITPAATVVAQH